MGRAMRTMDTEEARALWAEFSSVLQQDQPVTFLFWSQDLVGVNTRLRGVEVDVRGSWVSAPDWWIPASRRR